ncbi:ABC transporter permease [Micromonospora echinospora]|uniref:Carbohydrate ABC transporter membrane protein 1, CUT1 family n=1 Tax=Micromonospora echinospora TaxID=1877 RepID=A0A1C4ZMB9_MICEC|nr:sugar ABC transporter permease [Micromonospora echinospora]OZV81577.1 ABC transporter permease [Micromonospora echinospora]SCF34065.1 carbohydrate ABC transporter membrane protein 1, CUT1 family [Micromonospora echinospora]
MTTVRSGRSRFLAAAILPALALYAVFVLSPYAQAFYLALTDWTGVSGEVSFVGLDNFRRLVDDPLFRAALRNNALMLLVVPAVTILLGLLLAALVSFGGRGGAAGPSAVRGGELYRVAYFLPQVLALPIVAVLWQFVYNPNDGLLNGFLRGVGLDALARSWLGDPAVALWAVMAVLIWSSVGFYMVLFGAAMESIPREVLEAAVLDGAGRLAVLWRVVVPLLWDNVQVAFVYLGVLALDGFAVVQIMTVGPGGPDGATEVMGLGLYRSAFTYGRFGYAAAMGVALFFLTLAVAVVALRAGRRERVEYT